MRNYYLISADIFLSLAVLYSMSAPEGAKALFQKHCAVCHPAGSNAIDNRKSLHRGDLYAHNLRTPGDLVKKMRKPGPGMTRFDINTLPDTDAKEIADHVLKTF